ncbi:MAG: zinc dependent phospholipase C family protein [Oscillibacter sp.]|nr:zinc dependent phospholipase C family protein [Oscillibacter sp.]
MQKRSHLLLARSLLSREGGFPARRYELAFLFGSFQPDCNPFSYLKGSLRGKLFGGHTYANSRRYVNRRIRALQARARRSLRDYYALGKLTHYVADAFTWPHNPHFPGAGWGHHVYETELRHALEKRLAGAGFPPRQAPDVSPALPEEIKALHDAYLAEANPGLETDIDYILKASDLLAAGCRPAARPLPLSPACLETAGEFA